MTKVNPCLPVVEARELSVASSEPLDPGRSVSCLGYIATQTSGSLPSLPESLDDGTRELAAQSGEVVAGRNNVTDVITVGAMAHIPSLSSRRRRRTPEDYPDVPFYKAILAARHIPPVELPNSSQAIGVSIVSYRHIAVDGTVFELRGDQLYMFNALLAYRRNPTFMFILVQAGLDKALPPVITASRANKALQGVCQMFASVLPEGTEAVRRFGKGRGLTYQLSPSVVIKDVRDAPQANEIAHRRTVNGIAKAAGVRFGAVRDCITEEEWETQFLSSTGERLFPGGVADRILARCVAYKESFIEVDEVPDDCVLVLDMVRSLPYFNMNTRRALQLLRNAGYVPFRVRLPDAAESRGRGGRWCVPKEGARDVLLAAFEADAAAGVVLKPRWHRPRRKLSFTETLEAIECKTVLSPKLSTAEEIASCLHEEYGLEVTTEQVRSVAAEDPMIIPADKDGQPGYSDYAYRKIRDRLVPSGSKLIYIRKST